MAKWASLLIAAIIALPAAASAQPGKDAVIFGCRPVADVKADLKQRGFSMFAISARKDARHLVDKSLPWETFIIFSVDPTGSIGYRVEAVSPDQKTKPRQWCVRQKIKIQRYANGFRDNMLSPRPKGGGLVLQYTVTRAEDRVLIGAVGRLGVTSETRAIESLGGRSLGSISDRFQYTTFARTLILRKEGARAFPAVEHDAAATDDLRNRAWDEHQVTLPTGMIVTQGEIRRATQIINSDFDYWLGQARARKVFGTDKKLHSWEMTGMVIRDLRAGRVR